ncbi:hypothetical protein VTP01DRAFT_2359 [Rhizomucor pusillus]|uniref:uncharacterized protein n=1 Tax=Rhizomucor pusillus TaxID=4840 RepID=UPI0037426F01
MLEDPPEVLRNYLCTAFNQLWSSKLIIDYPLVFSPEYCKKLEETVAYIPSMARSAQRIIERSSEISAGAYTPSAIAAANLHAVSCLTKAMRPNGYRDHDIYTQLVISFYYSTRQAILSHKIPKVWLFTWFSSQANMV